MCVVRLCVHVCINCASVCYVTIIEGIFQQGKFPFFLFKNDCGALNGIGYMHTIKKLEILHNFTMSRCREALWELTCIKEKNVEADTAFKFNCN